MKPTSPRKSPKSRAGRKPGAPTRRGLPAAQSPAQAKDAGAKPGGKPPAAKSRADKRSPDKSPAAKSRTDKRSTGRRRSFSQATLALESEGPLGVPLGEALKAAGATGYALTHAFHAYPGRFHPQLVGTLLAAAARPGQTLFDPFMGGGTALVEGMCRGLTTLGNDLNPVAHLVTRERTRIRTGNEARLVEAELTRLAAQVEALRHEKHPPRYERPAQHRLTPHYQPHLLAELMQWIRLIDGLRDEEIRHTLRALFSAAVVKFSNLTSDSRQEPGTPPRFPKGAVGRYLVMKGQELVRAQVALGSRVPPGTPPPKLFADDARLLTSLEWNACDLIVTSPPYPGTYDYHAHHRLRMDWLELDGSALARAELAPGRERPAPGDEAPESWSAGFKDVLGTLARVLRPKGQLFLVVGDWISGGHAVNAGGMLTRIAKEAGWQPVSKAAAQRATHAPAERKAFARKGKWEHLLHFQRAGTGAAAPAKPAEAIPAVSTPAAAPPAPKPRRKERPYAKAHTRPGSESPQPPEAEPEERVDVPATARRVVSRRPKS